MKKRKPYMSIVLIVFGLIFCATAVTAADMTGTWEMAVETPAGTGNPTFELKQEDDKLTGTYTGVFGESPVEGMVKGDTFELTFESIGITMKYSGEIDGDQIKGTVDLGTYGQGSFTGKKI